MNTYKPSIITLFWASLLLIHSREVSSLFTTKDHWRAMVNHVDASNAQIASLVVASLVGCFLLLLLWWKKRSSNSPARLPLPPGTFGFLWVGETFKLLNAFRAGVPSTFLRERTAKFRSKTFKTQVFFHKTVVVQGVTANRFIAAAETKQQLVNSWPASLLKVLGENNPITKHGVPHRHFRRIIASCLGPVALQKLVGRVDLMTHLHFETCWKDAQSQIFLLSLIRRNSFRIACSVLAGIEDEALVVRMYEQFKIWSAGVVSLPVDLPGTTFRRALNAKQMLIREMGKIIESKRHVNADDPNANVLCMLMARDENGGFLNREELLEVILFLLLGGYDTTSATLSFVFKYLEQNSACYHRLLQEHIAIASQKNQGERLTWADVQNMKYTWALIQETLRLRPVNIGSVKEAKHDLTFDGYRIPQGWKMFFNMSSTHDEEKFFPEPQKFDPSRFDFDKLKDKNGPPRYVFIPFGIGPHSCPGGDFARMMISIYLHHLALRKIRWMPIDPNEKVHVFPTLKPAKNYPVKIFLDKQS